MTKVNILDIVNVPDTVTILDNAFTYVSMNVYMCVYGCEVRGLLLIYMVPSSVALRSKLGFLTCEILVRQKTCEWIC